MTHRIISSEIQPEFVFRHAQNCGCLCRQETTGYRGPIAFIGEGRVWGVAELRDVKPATQGKPAKDGTPAPKGFLWCFEEVRSVEGVLCAEYAAPAMFQNGKAWEPQFLQAGAQAALNAVLSSQDGLEPLGTGEMTQLPTEPLEAPKMACCVGKAGQLEMFG